MKNNVVKKILLPQLLFVGIQTGFLLGVSYNAMKIVDKKNIKDSRLDHTANTSFAITGTLITCLFMLYANRAYKGANKFATDAMKNYIKMLMKTKPEFDDFNAVYNNERAMQYITMRTFNSLPDNAQKELKRILTQSNQIINPLSVEDAYKQINQIIDGYIRTNPEFIPNLHAALADSYYKYIQKDTSRSR